MSLPIIKENFLKQPSDIRIESVIADGQWYYFEKWKRTAKVKEPELKQWLNNHQEELVESVAKTGNKKVPVYRADSEWVTNWYKIHNVDFEEEIVPKNYPVRIWDNKTETEHFLNNPRMFVSRVTVKTDHQDLLNRIEKCVLGSGEPIEENVNELSIYCLDPGYVLDKIRSSLSKQELKKLEFTTRRGYKRRDVSKFSKEFLNEAYSFYLPYARNETKSKKNMLKMFTDSEDDLEMLFFEWINEAMKKFNENLNIPFSGYLSNVLRFWPNDLPTNALGKELNDFHKEQVRILTDLQHELGESVSISDEEMAEKMGMDLEDYKKLNIEYQTWENFRIATTLEWGDANEERKADLVGYQEVADNDFHLAYRISKALIQTSIDLKDNKNTEKIINRMGDSTIDYELLDLEKKFVKKFSKNLENISKRDDEMDE